jgi:hypothetical protein
MTAGPILTGAQLEAAAVTTTQTHLDSYLREMERQVGEDLNLDGAALPSVRSWTTGNSLDLLPEDQLPAVVCISAGLADAPTRAGGGLYTATWALAFGVVCSANTQEQTNTLAKTYIAAIRALLIQHPTLGGYAQGLDWIDENYDELEIDDHRTLAAATATFNVEITSVTSTYGSPTEGGAAGPTVETYQITSQPTPLNQEIT